MTIVLIVLLVLLLCGGGWYGYRGGYAGVGWGNPIGIILLVIVLLLVLGLIGGPRLGYW